MTPTVEIERVVREVLAELTASRQAAPAGRLRRAAPIVRPAATDN